MELSGAFAGFSVGVGLTPWAVDLLSSYVKFIPSVASIVGGEISKNLLLGGGILASAGALYSLFQVGKNRNLFTNVHLPAAFIGSVFGAGLTVAVADSEHRNLGLYMLSLSTFHFSEYITTALFNYHKLSYDSFLLNHSREYHIAAVISWLEYGVRRFFFPHFSLPLLTTAGIVLAVSGDLLRKAAMFTARSNFSHQIVTAREEKHRLVTAGVYRISRHPSYLGWLLWSVGTQALLNNPICIIGYAAAGIAFFRDRIPYEEEFLLDFFKEEYEQYQQEVPIRIPFVHGHIATPYQRRMWKFSN
eukprot:m.57008 g.57008  ORF g.57008 m.57008 type:complete len:303 (-) comp12079_c0_seq2:129-1037(-)